MSTKGLFPYNQLTEALETEAVLLTAKIAAGVAAGIALTYGGVWCGNQVADMFAKNSAVELCRNFATSLKDKDERWPVMLSCMEHRGFVPDDANQHALTWKSLDSSELFGHRR